MESQKPQGVEETGCKIYSGAIKVDRLIGLVVKGSALRAEDPGFESCLHRDFSGVESYQ